MVALGNSRNVACVGHVNYMLFVYFSPWLLPNANAVSGGVWAVYKIIYYSNVYFILVNSSISVRQK